MKKKTALGEMINKLGFKVYNNVGLNGYEESANLLVDRTKGKDIRVILIGANQKSITKKLELAYLVSDYLLHGSSKQYAASFSTSTVLENEVIELAKKIVGSDFDIEEAISINGNKKEQPRYINLNFKKEGKK